VARPRRARARGAWRLPLRRAAFFVSTSARRFSGRRGGAVEDPALSPRGVHHLVLSGAFSCRLEGPTNGLDSTYAVRWGNGSHLLVASTTTARSRDQSPVLKNHSRLEGISCACDR
jgi:hypothetical protein